MAFFKLLFLCDYWLLKQAKLGIAMSVSSSVFHGGPIYGQHLQHFPFKKTLICN